MRRNTASLVVSLVLAALLPAAGHALSATNSDKADLMLADMALSRGDCRGGTERYLKAAQATSDAKISERANKVASDCQQVEASAKSARRWLKLEPDRAEAAAAVALAAVRLYKVSEAENAILLTHKLGGDEALTKLIAELSDAGGSAITLAAIRPLLDSPDVSDKLLTAGTDLALENFDFATAHKYADRLLVNDPASGDARAQLARVLTAEGDAVAAIAISQEAGQLEPETQRFAYADTLIRLDRLDEARAELDSLRTDTALRDEADLRLGKLAYQAGDMSEAGRRFGSLLSSPEVQGEAFFYLSSIAEREGRNDLALQGYTELLEHDAGGLLVRGRAARLLMKKNDRKAAFQLLDEFASKERSESLNVEFTKAALLEDLASPGEAIALLQLALERYPNHPGVRMQIALTQEKAGKTKDSLRNFEALLKDRPDDASLQNALGYSLADHNQKLPRAEQLIRKALEASPDNPAFLDSLGWVRYRRGDAPGAIPLLEKAYRIFPDPEIASHWGELLWVSGKQAEARALWARALARSPDAKALRATIERLTGTRLEPEKPKASGEPGEPAAPDDEAPGDEAPGDAAPDDETPPEPVPTPSVTGS
ncbi:MAG TPA: tetratricopeptide repeat protein [Steroidobacteraceae bacterium]|jgi:tetratricopeptide (TPR) repeat protein|nr:tetratricopeptide repeat protein [Steroidobacteraceae bacterium]